MREVIALNLPVYYTCCRELQHELILAKGEQKYMHDKLALMEVSHPVSKMVSLILHYTKIRCSIAKVHSGGGGGGGSQGFPPIPDGNLDNKLKQ